MSTRYVWERYYLKKVYGLQKSTYPATRHHFALEGTLTSVGWGTQVGYAGNYYKVDDHTTGKLYIEAISKLPNTLGTMVTVNGNGYPVRGSSGDYFTQDPTGNYRPNETILVANDKKDNCLWVAYVEGGNTVWVVRRQNYSDTEIPTADQSFYTATAVLESQEKGNYKDLATGNSRSSYNSDGITGNYWYVYKDSDSIDPSAVTYSKQDLYPGEPVTITVTPVTPTYGGTISYLYQYSIDGGSTWTTIGSKTTDTSVTMTIPEGAAQFQARVTASDGWGFTSTTPVKGPNLGVSQLKAYAAVSGVSRAGVKMYATVGGKIREIQKGYATVGGKIRKLF